MILRPTTWSEAARLAASHPDAAVFAGGTDLLRARATTWIDLSGVEDAGVRLDESHLVLGARVCFATLGSDPRVRGELRALADAAATMGAPEIRSRGTLGGNLAHASPAGDSLPPLVAAGAEARVVSPDRSAWLPLADLFAGPRRTHMGRSLLAAVRVPREPGRVSAFARVGRRRAHVIAAASAALVARLDGGVLRGPRLALGAVAPTVVRAPGVEALLEGADPCDPRVVSLAAARVRDELAPIDDVRASRAYRLEAAGVLVGRLLESLCAPSSS